MGTLLRIAAEHTVNVGYKNAGCNDNRDVTTKQAGTGYTVACACADSVKCVQHNKKA